MSPSPAERSKATARLRGWLSNHTDWLTARLRPPQSCILDRPGEGDGSTLEAFAAWCAARSGIRARVLLGGALTHQFVQPVSGVRPLYGEALASLARQRFAQYYGEGARIWPVQTWASEGVDGPRHGACAVHGLDLAALQRMAVRHQVRLTSIEPAWVALLHWLTQRQPAWAQDADVGVVLVEGARITWMHCSHGNLIDIRQRRLQSADWSALLERIRELRPHDRQTMPVLLAGYGIAGAGAAGVSNNLRLLTALEHSSFPQELLA